MVRKGNNNNIWRYTKIDFGQEGAMDDFTVYCLTESDFEMSDAEKLSDAEEKIDGDDIIYGDASESGTTSDLCAEFINALDNADVIIRAFCVSNAVSVSGILSQDVEVSKVYRGSEKLEGKTIQIISDNEVLCFGSLWDYANFYNSYVNIMKKDQEYLLFLTETGCAARYMQVSLMSYFALGETENVISENGSEVLYKEVKESEFFVADKVALDNVMEIKKYALETYMGSWNE